ncbi:carotenoid 1,2-hydratase [Prosthecochloris sp. HL-130-GSB]|jgi:carotenoid 1,2-hydratase|uniref:carotenoid 1,2-hydratase n=1 Tax=Prosthecochloris sp. HL-130-GSB TaxID=1974213 RepID=UPI000A1C0732|nr:carotenoid 1,2-hydratase [Prosthecochloris sp. HL-130-GSB]ARM31398.1 carotenoid 1,2-hydratase [Prosthecochloris sp. HL-130-GSB]MBO8093461.1 carotenoid 1,2-hydratase [Prosthecochloris sp.]
MNISTLLEEDIWHDLKDPGSYEWWYFDAEDETQGISVVCIWFAGFAFSPYYMQHYMDWRHNGRSDAPSALEYAGFSFQLYHHGREIVNFIKEGPSHLFTSNGRDIDVQFERNRFHYDHATDTYILDIAFSYPARRQEVTSRLRFKARKRYSYSKEDNNNNGHVPHHQWLLCVPYAVVSGDISLTDTRNGNRSIYTLDARGYHDHNLGAMPVHEYIDKWYWGRAYSRKYDLIYYVIYFRNNGYRPLAITMLHDNEQNTFSVYDDLDVTESSYTRGLFAPMHSRTLRFTKGDLHIDINQQRVLDTGPFYLRFGSSINFRLNGEHHGDLRGISEFLKPGRLQSRILRFFTRSRVWREGERSFMYDRYNFFKTYFNWFKP